MALFWLMAVYVVGASTFSVVGQLFGGPLIARADEAACATELARLTNELQDRASSTLADPSTTSPEWLANWDRTFTALAGQCGRLEATRTLLGGVRSRVGNMLRAYREQDGPEMARIARRLEPFITPP